jgi:pimeloyl-ACP methyl ester carboxylesterase
MDAAMDYCRQIIADMHFNKAAFTGRVPVRVLAIGGEYSIPNMGGALTSCFTNVTSLVVPASGHFVPEEQPEALAHSLLDFLRNGSLHHYFTWVAAPCFKGSN